MLSLDDERWAALEGGYHEVIDACPYVRRLYDGDTDDAFWEEFWLNLYHQEDVGTASYAVVPHMVEARAHRAREGDLYRYCRLIERARESPGNPPLPDWLRESYPAALARLAGWAGEDLAALDMGGRKVVLAYLAQYAALPVLGDLLEFSADYPDFADAVAAFSHEMKL